MSTPIYLSMGRKKKSQLNKAFFSFKTTNTSSPYRSQSLFKRSFKFLFPLWNFFYNKKLWKSLIFVEMGTNKNSNKDVIIPMLTYLFWILQVSLSNKYFSWYIYVTYVFLIQNFTSTIRKISWWKMLLLQALWVLAISQDRNEDRSPQESSGKRQRFIKFVHREWTLRKEISSGSLREVGQGFKGS